MLLFPSFDVSEQIGKAVIREMKVLHFFAT